MTWLNASESHRTYRSVEDGLIAVFREADAHSIPQSLLIDRLNLGAARRLPPKRLVEGMRGELRRLMEAGEVVARVEGSPAGHSLLESSRKTDLLNAVSIYLSGGLSQDLIFSLLTDSAQSGRTVDEVFQACAVLLQLDRVGKFSQEELLRLGNSLVASSVAPAGYAAIGSFIVRTYLAGREGSGLLAAAGQILRQGGGLPQMELELGRRR